MLKSTWELKTEIKSLTPPKPLKDLISQFIAQHDADKSRLANLLHQGNLHYIIDNINKPSLFSELKAFMHKIDNKTKG